MPKLNPEPSPVLAVLAAQSNDWVPACDPPGPTKGLWGEHGPPGSRTWQEYYMTGRDCLTWTFTSPICTCGAQAPPESSAWNWMTQWLPTWGNGHSSPPCPPRDQHPGMRILAGGPPGYVAPTSPWAWLVQWLPTNSLPVRMLGGS